MNKFTDILNNLLKVAPFVLGIILFFLVMNKVESCNNNIPIGPIVPVPTHIVNNVTPVPVTTRDTQIIPTGNKVEVVFKPTIKPASPRDKTIDARYIVSSNPKCITCTPAVTEDITIKTKIGFVFEPKIYLGYTDGGVTVGYDTGFFRYGNYSLDLLVTIPYIGLGVSRLITNNFFGMAGVNSRWLSYNSIEDVSSYKLDTTALTKVGPVVGVGFHF